MVLLASASRIAALASVIAIGSAMAQPKIAPKYHAAPAEILQLPKYCYGQYVDGALVGYEFTIPYESCGVSMNHFCPGLVDMIRAQNMNQRKAERIGSIQHAIENINYTIHDMKPGCFIAKDVLAAKRRAETLATFIR